MIIFSIIIFAVAFELDIFRMHLSDKEAEAGMENVIDDYPNSGLGDY